jgi:hypothetical protein
MPIVETVTPSAERLLPGPVDKSPNAVFSKVVTNEAPVIDIGSRSQWIAVNQEDCGVRSLGFEVLTSAFSLLNLFDCRPGSDSIFEKGRDHAI